MDTEARQDIRDLTLRLWKLEEQVRNLDAKVNSPNHHLEYLKNLYPHHYKEKQ